MSENLFLFRIMGNFTHPFSYHFIELRPLHMTATAHTSILSENLTNGLKHTQVAINFPEHLLMRINMCQRTLAINHNYLALLFG